MNVFEAISQGFRSVLRAPGLIALIWLLNVLFALPAAMLMSDLIEESIGASLFDETLEQGFDAEWWSEFTAEGDGLVGTFGVTAIGAGAIYENLEALWTGRLFTEHLGLVALGVAYALLFMLLLGGILDRLARPSVPRNVSGFLAACGRTFLPFLGLTVMSGLLYYGIYRLSRLLFGSLEEAMLDVTEERIVYRGVLAIAVLTVLLLHVVRLVFDLAKIAVATVAPRPGVFRGLGSALRFIGRHPVKVLGVYSLPSLLGLALMALYALLAPGATQSTFSAVLLAFLFAQVYLAARIAVRLGLLGAELHLYRASL